MFMETLTLIAGKGEEKFGLVVDPITAAGDVLWPWPDPKLWSRQ